MTKRSTRTLNREKLAQALNHIDQAAELYDVAIEVYLPQFPNMKAAFTQSLELLQMARTIMEQSFDGI